MWPPYAIYLFWGPLTVWCLFVALLALKGSPFRVRVNLAAVVGAALASAAVTAGWDFEAPMDLNDLPNGIWWVLIASWLALITPLGCVSGLLGIWADFNVANRGSYSITGDGFPIAIVAISIMMLGILVPISVGNPEPKMKKGLSRRLLTVRLSGIRRKDWDAG